MNYLLSGARLTGGAVWFPPRQSQKSARSDEISEGWRAAGGSAWRWGVRQIDSEGLKPVDLRRPTNIHYPDSSLLGDGVRVLTRTMKKITAHGSGHLVPSPAGELWESIQFWRAAWNSQYRDAFVAATGSPHCSAARRVGAACQSVAISYASYPMDRSRSRASQTDWAERPTVKPIVIPGSGIERTRLGFGCSQLMGGITRDESLRLLEAAFASGIRHFDTAPSYGYGKAGSVLGGAFRSRRDQITIATKYGIRSPRNQGMFDIARRLARPILRRLPGVKSYASRAAGRLASRARFSADELRMSIEASLRALQSDYIDILLLHEATVGDLTDELFAQLERSVKEGKIRTFGVGSEVGSLSPIYQAERRFCRVAQYEWSVLSTAQTPFAESFTITHRSLSSSLVRLRAALRAKPQTARSWSGALNLDLSNPSVLSLAMFGAACSANPDGIVLFSSRRVANITANSALLSDDAMIRVGAEFARLVAQDGSAILSAPTH